MTRAAISYSGCYPKAAGVGMFYYRPDGDIRAGRLAANPFVLNTSLIYFISRVIG
jgi:hypothetical protein